MAREDTDLPFGDAFGPNQLETGDEREELAVVLELIEKYEGDEDGFDEAIIETFFPDDDGTRAKNVRLGVKPSGYGITDEDFKFTDLGEELYKLRDEPQKLYDRFARHILRNLHGQKGIEIVEDLRAQGKSPVNKNLKQEFRDQYGFHIDRTSNHWSQMRGWLSKAGVVNTGTHHYEIDHGRINELTGADSETILELDDLEDEQQAFLRALAIVDPNKPIKNVYIREIAEEAYGVEITQSGIKNSMLEPLEEAGYIEWEHVSGKPNLIEPTDKFEAEVLKPILDDLAERTGAPRSVLRKSYTELLDEMDSDNTYDKGVALETLAVKLGRTLGLEFVGWRVRGRKTGGSEVDVIFDDLGPLYNRVQIQCKNVQKQLSSKHVAREVGISRMLQTNTILMIAREGLSNDARQFANRVMQHENLAIVFIEGKDIERLDQDPSHLIDALESESARIRRIKRLGGREGVEEDEETTLQEREDEALEKFSDEIEEARSEPTDTTLTEFDTDG
ncbi:restriction endonuclease [Haloarchaeobius iranensis]|uniref:Restriction endonuclease n=1 Tax=Haloarchaeobius iranensis TaxID=996166 RepID=A0A1G9ZWR9_9EURY|nr:restriction endonuclease [Haloarchaeobius iranensis]SDN25535.1 Restriction endonuclease [Haloarchaeobius iranensis]